MLALGPRYGPRRGWHTVRNSVLRILDDEVMEGQDGCHVGQVAGHQAVGVWDNLYVPGLMLERPDSGF